MNSTVTKSGQIRILGILFLFLFGTGSLHAQITWSGIYDFKIKQGGKNSKLDVNQVSNEYFQFEVFGFQLFADAQLDDNISFSAKLETNPRSTTNLKGINLDLAYVTFSDIFGADVNVSAGKILTPFGSYSKRQLAPNNPVIGDPLFFYYATNVSPVSGYLDSAGVLFAQGSSLYGSRLSTIYCGGYFTGVELFGDLADDFLQYDFAVMNAPLSSTTSEVHLNKNLTFQGRVALHPSIWATVGASYSTGSFVEKTRVNYQWDYGANVEEFKQNTLGFDLNLNYLYYELNAEYIQNMFRSPYIVYKAGDYVSGLVGADHLDLKSNEILADLKIDAPFYPGLYFAGRFNAVTFGSIVDPYASSSTYGKKIHWDHDLTRFEVALGYKLARGVLMKIGYQWTNVDENPQPDLGVFGFQTVVSF